MFNIIPYSARIARRENNRDYLNPFSDDFFRAFFGNSMTAGGGFRVDVKDEKDSYIMEAELPGVSKENVHISVNDGVLTIAAEINDEKDDKNDNYVCRERRYGSMSRAFNLEGVNEDGISAEYKDGILKLTLPKMTQSAPLSREIAIN